MAKPTVKYHIPPTWAWNYSLVSEHYVRMERERALIALADLATDEAKIDADVMAIEQEIRGHFATANATMMRAFEARLRMVLLERKRLNGIGRKLDGALKQIHIIGAQRGWTL